MKKMVLSDQEWKKKLDPQRYDILRGKGTEAPFSGKYIFSKDKGTFQCAACGLDLFSSDTKFDSGTGWPSFYKPIKPENVIEQTDTADGMVRTEIICGRCGSHLGHVFKDAPQTPTGLRYCMNSCALDLESKGDK